MKEYKKTYDVQAFNKRIKKYIEEIKKLNKNYIFTTSPSEEEENYIFLHIFIFDKNDKIISEELKYNTIDVISEYLRGIKETMQNLKGMEE